MKKTFVYGLVSLLFAGFLTTCTDLEEIEIPDNLAEYKEDAKANLTAYVETLDANDYSGENWTAIEELANRGKENIDTAINKQGVDSAFTEAKDGITQIPLIDKAAAAKYLAEYKEGAKAYLASYFGALYPNDYSSENWAAIEEIANKGKENIDIAIDVKGVDSAFTEALDEIRQIPWIEKTVEEHLERIREKLHSRYFDVDSPTYSAAFPDQIIDGKWTYVTVESFDVEIILSYDGKPEHFLVTHKPFAIGYVPGIIIGNEYNVFWINRIGHSNNPFEENGIEKGNRYYMFPGSPRNGFAAIIDGAFTDLIDGHIYSENEIKNRLEFLRSEQGLSFMRTYSSPLQ